MCKAEFDAWSELYNTQLMKRTPGLMQPNPPTPAPLTPAVVAVKTDTQPPAVVVETNEQHLDSIHKGVNAISSRYLVSSYTTTPADTPAATLTLPGEALLLAVPQPKTQTADRAGWCVSTVSETKELKKRLRRISAYVRVVVQLCVHVSKPPLCSLATHAHGRGGGRDGIQSGRVRRWGVLLYWPTRERESEPFHPFGKPPAVRAIVTFQSSVRAPCSVLVRTLGSRPLSTPRSCRTWRGTPKQEPFRTSPNGEAMPTPTPTPTPASHLARLRGGGMWAAAGGAGGTPTTMRFPIAAEQANAQLAPLLAAARPSPFGKGTQTVVDETVRVAKELKPDEFELAGVHLHDILDDVRVGLVPEAAECTAVLHKLNVMGAGSFFKPHKDTPRGADTCFGTLVVALPVFFQGGDLVRASL